MRAADCDILMVPGLGDSGPVHWQTRWAQKLSTARRVEQKDWERPVLSEWVDRIVDAVNEAERPAVILAHSLGTIAVAHSAPRLGSRMAGAFLVAPPQEEVSRELVGVDPAFVPYPRRPLPFPAVVIASRDDAYADFTMSEALAKDWGAAFVDAGQSGHINTASGHGPWPEGLLRFANFLSKL